MKPKGNKYCSTYSKTLTKKFLQREYTKNNNSTFDIAKIIKCNPCTVTRYLYKYNIRIKTRKELRKDKLGNRFKYGKYKCVNGYNWIFKPDYDKNRISKYVREHRLIIEEKLGRRLTKEEKIHHKDLNKINNKLSNLFLCKNQSEHSKIHRQLEKIAGELFKLNILKFRNGKYYINQNAVKI